MHNDCTLPIHPRTGLTAVGIVAGRPVWPIKGGSEDGDDDSGSGGTQTATWTPPASQADLDRIVESRLARERQRYGGVTPEQLADIRQKAEAHDALEYELSSEADKKAQKAADEAYTAAMTATVPRVVAAEFRAEAKGVLTKEQLDALIEDMDLMRYANDDGEPDTAKIAAKIAAFAPAPPRGAQQHRPLGQGHQQQAAPSARDLGRAEAEKRFGKKQ